MASVAEMGLGFMIDLARHVSRSVGRIPVRSGSGAPDGPPTEGLDARIIGYGAISQELAPIALALGMKVLVADPYKQLDQPGLRQVDLPTLLGEADFVVCLAVATEETENLMDAAAFGRMKRDAFFINLSRGNLVDEAALEAALDEGRIAGAAMDVGRAQDQKPSLRLARRPDVIATPHTAGLTMPSIEHQAFDTVEQVRALLAGQVPPGAVNAELASRLKRLRAS
jgi:D-3-phosphoglycerate dehydrogenase